MSGNNFLYNVVINGQVQGFQMDSNATFEQVQAEVIRRFHPTGHARDVKVIDLKDMLPATPASDLPRDGSGQRWLCVDTRNAETSVPLDIIQTIDGLENQSQSTGVLVCKIPNRENHSIIVRREDKVCDIVQTLMQACQIKIIRSLTIPEKVTFDGDLRHNYELILNYFDNGGKLEMSVDAALPLSIKVTRPDTDKEVEKCYECFSGDEASNLLDDIKRSPPCPLGELSLLAQHGYLKRASLTSADEVLYETENNIFTSCSSGLGHSGNLSPNKSFIRPLDNEAQIYWTNPCSPTLRLFSNVKYYVSNDKGELIFSPDINLWKQQSYIVVVDGIEFTNERVASGVRRFFNTDNGWQERGNAEAFTSKEELLKRCQLDSSSVKGFIFFAFYRHKDLLPKLNNSLCFHIKECVKAYCSIDKGRIHCPSKSETDASILNCDRWLYKQNVTDFKPKHFIHKIRHSK